MPLTKLRPLICWCLYGWASDTFPILITTFIFSTYFIEHIAPNPIMGTTVWAEATSVAGLIIGILSPILGSIADQRGRHKSWLIFFTLGSILASFFLWFATPTPSSVSYTLILYVLGIICLELALVFYNAFLPRLVSHQYIGRLSGWSWSLGYFGGIVALTLMLFFAVLHPPAWLDSKSLEQVRIVGPFSALWFAVFGLPLFFFLPDTKASTQSLAEATHQGLKTLGSTLKNVMKEKNIFLFLIARMIFTDGLNTLFAFGGIYAAGTFHFTFEELILLGITLNLMAGLGAFSLAWLDDFLGSKPTIVLSLICLCLFGLALLLCQDRLWFWITACCLSLFVGPVQAASRSLMAHLVPVEKATEYFGFFALTGRITAFVGPWLLGLSTHYFHSQRAGMASILLFFIIGLVLIKGVKGPGQIAKSLRRG